MTWWMLAYGLTILATGIAALRRERDREKHMFGRGWAIALILGGATVLVSLLYLVLFES